MLVIFGIRGRAKRDQNAQPMTMTCPRCGETVQMEPVRQRRYFHLFWIPLIPLEQGEAAWKCPQCKRLFGRHG